LAHLLRSAGQGALPGIWDELARLEIPLLALAGERDERYVSAARRIALLAPRGDARPVMGAGHAAHLERPEAVAELLLQFLDQHLGEDVVVD
jgi:pimeloyl-ACP methyl ester carboxylesterase